MSPRTDFCPYVGLDPFSETHRAYFFGRERDQRVIVSNLLAAPITVLYGASGVGKSSVLLAGVVPILRTTQHTAVVVFRDWHNPSFLDDFKAECLRAISTIRPIPSTIDERLALDELLGQAASALQGTMLILLDQFEDFLSRSHSEMEVSFESGLARAVNRDEVDANFLIVLREDALAKLDRFQARIRNLLGNLLRLEHLDARAAEEAIRKPLDAYYDHFFPAPPMCIEKKLVQNILTKARIEQIHSSKLAGVGEIHASDEAGRIEVPFLQLVMKRLWEEEMKENSSVLRLSTLKRLGGVQEIMRSHVNDVMKDLGKTEQRVCVLFFDRLVTPAGNKIAYTEDELRYYAGDLKGYVPSILHTLSNKRILRGVASRTGARYEIFHDVLAPAILDWRSRYIREQEVERESIKKAQELVQVAQQISGKPPGKPVVSPSDWRVEAVQQLVGMPKVWESALGIYFMVWILAVLYILLKIWPETTLVVADDWVAELWGGRLVFSLSLEARYLLIVAAAGALGSYGQLATSFASYGGNRQLVRSWAWWYISRPFTGMALAIILYLVVCQGLIPSEGGVEHLSPHGVAAMAAIAGMCTQQTMDKLNEVFDRLFRAEKPSP